MTAEQLAELEAYDARHLRALSDLRSACEKTQREVAEALGVEQTHVSRIEGRGGWYLSTLQKYARALGGELQLVFYRDGEQFYLEIGDLAREPELATAE